MRRLLKVVALGASLLAGGLGMLLLASALAARQAGTAPWWADPLTLGILGGALTLGGLAAYLVLGVILSGTTDGT